MTFKASIHARKQGAIGSFYYVDIAFDAPETADLRSAAIVAANAQGWEVNHVRKIVETQEPTHGHHDHDQYR